MMFVCRIDPVTRWDGWLTVPDWAIRTYEVGDEEGWFSPETLLTTTEKALEATFGVPKEFDVYLAGMPPSTGGRSFPIVAVHRKDRMDTFISTPVPLPWLSYGRRTEVRRAEVCTECLEAVFICGECPDELDPETSIMCDVCKVNICLNCVMNHGCDRRNHK